MLLCLWMFVHSCRSSFTTVDAQQSSLVGRLTATSRKSADQKWSICVCCVISDFTQYKTGPLRLEWSLLILLAVQCGSCGCSAQSFLFEIAYDINARPPVPCASVAGTFQNAMIATVVFISVWCLIRLHVGDTDQCVPSTAQPRRVVLHDTL